MPVLQVRFSAEARGAGGKPVQLPPPVALRERGPCVMASVTLLESMVETLVAEGKEAPGVKSGLALIDTGASATCVDENTATELKLPAIDIATIATPSDASAQRRVFPVTIAIQGLPHKLYVRRAIGVDLAPQGLIALIGRDALSSCVLIYNGPAGEITLAL